MADYRDFPPVEPVELPDHLRQTFLKHFERCPRSGYLYLKYDGAASNHPMDRGSLFHRFAKEATEALVEREETSMPPDVGKELMQSLIASETDLVIPRSEQEGLRIMAYHWCLGTLIDPAKVAGIEVSIELTIRGWRVTGHIDLLMVGGNVAEVRDYKTSWNLPTQGDMQQFQTSLYALGVAKGKLDGADLPLDHIEIFNLVELYPRYLWTEEGLAYRDVIVTRDELLDNLVTIEGLVERVEEAFETWRFKAVEGEHCSECPARAECPLPARLRPNSFAVDTPVIESEADAERVATRRHFTKKQITADNKALRTWLGDHGSLRYGRDLLLELAPSETRKMATSQEQIAIEAHRAVEYGTDFNIADHYKTVHGTSMKDRALTEHELRVEQETNEQGDDDG